MRRGVWDVYEITTELKTTGHLKDVRYFFLYTKAQKSIAAEAAMPVCRTSSSIDYFAICL